MKKTIERTLSTKQIQEIFGISSYSTTRYIEEGCPHTATGLGNFWNEREVRKFLAMRDVRKGRPRTRKRRRLI